MKSVLFKGACVATFVCQYEKAYTFKQIIGKLTFILNDSFSIFYDAISVTLSVFVNTLISTAVWPSEGCHTLNKSGDEFAFEFAAVWIK